MNAIQYRYGDKTFLELLQLTDADLISENRHGATSIFNKTNPTVSTCATIELEEKAVDVW